MKVIKKTIKILFIISTLVVTNVLVSCSVKPKYNFENAEQAVQECRNHLADLREKKKANIEELTNLTTDWLELEDSVYTVMDRDSSVTINSKIAEDYFRVADSIHHEIARITKSEQRSLKDVISLKIKTARGREKMMTSKDYKDAVAYFSKLDETGVYADPNTAIKEYVNLINNTKKFKNLKDVSTFMTKEDICFRSLIQFLPQVKQSTLKYITDKTGEIFGDLYKTVTGRNNDSREMIFLTMRFNRRVVLNALACERDIKAKKRLDRVQRANYRWMLIQPMMTLDSYSLTCLSNDQEEQILRIADNLPEYICYLDGNTEEAKKNSQKLIDMLSNYFLKTYLRTLV